jgi:hypothetical protein
MPLARRHSPKAIGRITDSTRFSVFRVYVIIATAMVSKLPTTLARLTLYSGSNCSLCDVYTPLFIRIALSSHPFAGCQGRAHKTQANGKLRVFSLVCGGPVTQTVTYIWTFVCSAISNLTSSTSTIQDRNTGGRSMSIGSRLCTSTAKKSRRVAGTDRL